MQAGAGAHVKVAGSWVCLGRPMPRGRLGRGDRPHPGKRFRFYSRHIGLLRRAWCGGGGGSGELALNLYRNSGGKGKNSGHRW